MSVSHHAIAAAASHGAVTATERRARSRVVPAIVLAVLFGALWAAYFAVDAGVDYPEPWAQAAR